MIDRCGILVFFGNVRGIFVFKVYLRLFENLLKVLKVDFIINYLKIFMGLY